jgi:dihydropyrimidine dehydrogenase (NAD+) subunit PreA
MDLTTNFIGLKLKNPVIVAAGPLTGNGELMRKAVKAGAGAVVTKTIVNEIRPNVRPRLYFNNKNMQNIELYSEFTLEEWEKQIAFAKKHGAVVIANIMAHTPSEMSYIARRVEQFGADAIELGISIPHGEGMEILVSDPNKLYDLVTSAVSKIDIPVMVKLSSNVDNITKLAKAAEKAGASAISAIDTVRSIIGVDINKGKTLLPTYGGYSGPAIRPIGLAAVAAVSQAVSIPVCGIGGIENSENVLEYMMLGASVVQMGTSLIINGVDYIAEVIQNLGNWMDGRGYVNFEQIRGIALASLKSFEEIKVNPFISSLSKDCSIKECNRCKTACIYEAIDRVNDKILVNTNLCTGCGLCVSICPNNCFKFVWK